MTRYWLYKVNRRGGPAGWAGDWESDLFASARPRRWGGHEASLSPEVHRALDEEVSVGDVIVAYQTDRKAVIGFCRVDEVTGRAGARGLVLEPIERLDPVLKIHEQKHGTVLASSAAVNGPVMLRELERAEMKELLALTNTPRRVLKGRASANGFYP